MKKLLVSLTFAMLLVGDEMEIQLFHAHGPIFSSVVLNCAVTFGDVPLEAKLEFDILPGGSPVTIDRPRLSAIQVNDDIGVTTV